MDQGSSNGNGVQKTSKKDTPCQESKDSVDLVFKMKRSCKEIVSSDINLDQFPKGEVHELEKHSPNNSGREIVVSGDDIVQFSKDKVHEIKMVDIGLVENQEGHGSSDSGSDSDDFDGDIAPDDGEYFFRLPKERAEYCREKLKDFEDIPREYRQPNLKKSSNYHGEAISELFQGPRDEKPEDLRIRLFSMGVKHPWSIVDYHLYLLQIEGTTNQEKRQNGTWLRDGVECRPLCYEEFFEEDTFDPALVGMEPSLLFAALPVADHGVQFHGSTYVLEYDWNTKILSARHFNSLPDDLRNIECVWKESVVVYSLPIMEIVDIMKDSMAQRYRRIEFLSTNYRCTTPYVVNDDPGMELVMAYQFCQFAVDFASAIFVHMSAENLGFLKSELLDIMEEIRLTLQRASYRAWFAVREGLSMERFSHKVSFDRYLNDLFTYNKSIEEGSLRGKNWSAFGLDTCSILRDEHTQARQVINEQHLQEVFAPLDEEKSPEQVFENMLANTNEAPADEFLNTEINSPPILLPPLDENNSDEIDLDEFDLDNMIDVVIETPVSSNIAQPAATEADGCEITGYHDVPLENLLDHAAAMFRNKPELDTLENRGRLGAFFAELEMGTNKGSLGEPENLPQQGNWSI